MEKGNFWKKFIVLPIICLMFMVSGKVSAEAPSTVTVNNDSILSSDYYICVKNYSDSSHCFKAPVHYVDVDGTSVPAYCIEENLSWYSVGATLTKQSMVDDPGYIYLLKNGTPSALGLDKAKAGYVTQMAVWWYTDIKNGTDLISADFKGDNFSSIYSDPQNLYGKIKSLVQGAQNAKSSSTSSSSGTLQFTGDTKMVYSEDFTTFNAVISAQTSSLNSAKVYSQMGFTDNSGILSYSGNVIQVKLPVNRIPNGNLQGSVTIWAEAPGGTSSTTTAYKYHGGTSQNQNLLVPVTITTTGTITGTKTLSFARTCLNVEKQDDSGKPLSGAQLKVTDSSGNVVKWTSDGSTKQIYDLAPGQVTIEETEAPEGYVKVAPKTATLVAGTCSNVTIKNSTDEIEPVVIIQVNKVNSEGKQLMGARMRLTCNTSGATFNFKTTPVPQIITGPDSEGREIISGEQCTLTEIEAPKRYILKVRPITQTVVASSEPNVFEMENDMNSFIISKQDATTGKELPGAHLVLRDSDGKLIDEWVSGDKSHVVAGILDGEYTLHEKIAPDGYVLASDVKFTVEAGMVNVPIVMKNEATKIKFEKKEKDTDKFLPGAELVIKDSNGKEMYRWRSTNEAHIITGLKVGETYTLEEVTAPEGYDKAKSVMFKVNNTTDVQVVTMYDEQTIVTVPDTGSFTSMMIYGTGAFVLTVGICGTYLYLRKRKSERF